MATTRKIPADKGLNARMFLTGGMLVILFVGLGAVLAALHVPIYFVIAIPAVLLFLQYRFSDKIALFGMNAHVVTPEQEPELHGIVDRLCALADMPKPQVAIAETDIPNAFATGRNPQHAVVCATRGIMRRLDEAELEAVLAHEISHVAHRDVAIMTVASVLGVVAGMLTRVAIFAGMFGGGNRNNQNAAVLDLIVLLVSVLVYAISFLLTSALSRYRELLADRSGAILIGRPALLASALVKVSGDMSRIPTRDLRAAEHFNAFFFAPALTGGTSLSSLFSTHPSLEKRLAQLSELEAEMNRAQ